MIESALKSALFRGISSEEFFLLIEGRYVLKSFAAGDPVAFQGDPCQSLMVILKGRVRGKMMDQAGRLVVIEDIEVPGLIAPAFVFASDNHFPVHVSAMTEVSLLSFGKETFTRMLQENEWLLLNYLKIIADRSKFLTDKIRSLRFGSMKSQLARYLLDLIPAGETGDFLITHSQQELADLFGVTRPALARALREMSGEGLFEYEKNRFRIVNREGLFHLFRRGT